MCVLKTDTWRAILTWIESKLINLEQLKVQSSRSYGDKWSLEMFLKWFRDSGKDALKRAEYVLEKGRVKPEPTATIEQHIEQLLEMMNKEYLLDQYHKINRYLIWRPRKEVFGEMSEEIPKLVAMYRSFDLQSPILVARFSTTLDKILRLSSWTPSVTHNKHLRELLRNALLMLNDLGGNEEYHDYLRDFMTRRAALCAFTLDNGDLISTGDYKTTAELCKNLRRLAQNLWKIASTKAEQYQNLYENFIAHKKDLSDWLDSASPGQGKLYIWFLSVAFYIKFIFVGRSLVDSFTDSLKDMASSMRREANFWNSQSNHFHKWPNISQTYGCAIDAMPSEQLNEYGSSSTPPIHDSVTQVNLYPEFFIDINTKKLISRMLSPNLNVCRKPRNECRRLSPIYKNCR